MSSSNPTVSVLLPVSIQDTSYLQTCIESILTQVYTDFELIILDKTETAEVVEPVNDYDDNRIQVLDFHSDSPLSNVLNTGIQESNGKFIARQRASDYSEPTRLDRQVEYLETNPDIAVVGSGAYQVNSRRGRVSLEMVPTTVERGVKYRTHEWIDETVMIRRDVIKETDGYDSRFEELTDYEFLTRISKDYHIGNINEPLYNIRLPEKTLSYEKILTREIIRCTAVMKNHPDAPDFQTNPRFASSSVLPEVQRTRFQSDFHSNLASELDAHGFESQARQHCVKALKSSYFTNPVLWKLLLRLIL